MKTTKDYVHEIMFYIIINSRCGLHCNDYCKYKLRCDMSRLAIDMMYGEV